MNAPTYISIAAAWKASPERLDIAVRSAVFAAANTLERAQVLRALSSAKSVYSASVEKKAA